MMKKVIIIAICVLGSISFSSCRSTSSTCGLADNATINITKLQQINTTQS
jgi:hypothetical protein